MRHVYIIERDRFMVGQLQMRLQQSKPGEITNVLCVVGRNHLEGMTAKLREGTVIDDRALERLTATPEGGPLLDNLHEHVEATQRKYYMLIGGSTATWLLIWAAGHFMQNPML
jgi:pheromone shutdown protein TraB